MMAPQRVSVIVPAKSERRNLPRLLASLPPVVELIVCDASDDGTRELALHIRPERTRVLAAQGSIAATRQLRAEASRGDLLVFTDADVAFADGYFARPAAITTWDGISGAKLSTGEFARYYEAVRKCQQVTYSLLGVAAASESNMVMTRAPFRDLGGFHPELGCNEDTELFLRASRRCWHRARFDPELVVWAHVHRRLRRGVGRKSAHALVRTTLLYALCCTTGMGAATGDLTG